MEQEHCSETGDSQHRTFKFLGRAASLGVGVALSTVAIELVTGAIDHPLALPVAVAVATGANMPRYLSNSDQG
jgi:hypothetical protein